MWVAMAAAAVVAVVAVGVSIAFMGWNNVDAQLIKEEFGSVLLVSEVQSERGFTVLHMRLLATILFKYGSE